MKAELILRENFLQFPEGPRLDERGNLYFGDALERGFYRYSEKLGVEEIDSSATGIGGIVLHKDGGVIYSGRQGMMHFNPISGEINRVNALVDSMPLTNVNDIEADRDGNLYGGTLDFAAFDQGIPPQPGFLFRLSKGGQLSKLREVSLPNGLAFSPANNTFYFSESGEGVFRYDLDESGTVTSRILIAEIDDSDGIALDIEGNLWVARYLNDHVLCFNTNGKMAAKVLTPFKNVASLTFGGPDMRDLFITGGVLMEMGQGGVAKIRVDIPGLKSHKTNVDILKPV